MLGCKLTYNNRNYKSYRKKQQFKFYIMQINAYFFQFRFEVYVLVSLQIGKCNR